MSGGTPFRKQICSVALDTKDVFAARGHREVLGSGQPVSRTDLIMLWGTAVKIPMEQGRG